MELGLRGKKAFVTGGTAGIGLAITRTLLAEGADVGVCGRDSTRLEQATTDLRELTAGTGGRGVHGVVADVTDPAQLTTAIEEVATELAGLDLLVANAGGTIGGGLLETSQSEWSATYALNVLHAAHAIRSAVPHMRSRGGGSVVIIASISGWKPGPASSYATAKAAEIHLASVLAEELAPYRIRVNAVSPGSVLFPGGGWDRYRQSHPREFHRFVQQELPTGCLLKRDEVARVVVFVLSDCASGINGAHIPVDAAQRRATACPFPVLSEG